MREVNLEQWKKLKVKEVGEVYELLKPFDSEIRRDEFWDKFSISTTADTFPYNLATSISAQFEGTGKRERYNLRFYVWIGAMHAMQGFDIDTDEENKATLEILKKVSQEVRLKTVRVLQKELATFKDRNLSGTDKYAAWRMKEPGLQGKIQRIETMIAQLKIS